MALTASDDLIAFVVHARPAPRRLGHGRIVCIGDAAHAMEPNLGQGGCQGIEDAVALGVAAARCTPDAVLPAFQRMRLARIRGFVRCSAEGRLDAHGMRPVRAAWCTLLRAAPGSLHRTVIRGMHGLPDYR